MSSGEKSLFMAGSVAEAVAALTERGKHGAPLAGATWIMRSPIRGEDRPPFHVGIGRIPELNATDITPAEIRIGACVTHARLSDALAGLPECTGLVAAAGGAANPAIRQIATIGGNLCAWNFAASDLAPALLALDAEIELEGREGRERLTLQDFLGRRRNLPPGTLLTHIVVPRRSVRTAHARLPLRKAGDYPVAIVSLAAVFDDDGAVQDIRVTVGSVEDSPRRWEQLERHLKERPLDPDAAHRLAESETDGFAGRESVEAPGWYRVRVLPALVRRAARAVLASG